MKKLITLFIPIFALGMIYLGCQGDGPIEPAGKDLSAPKLVIPEGAIIESATLSVYAFEVAGQTVNAHRITEPWDEATVTWNNFGGAYDGAVVNSFTASVVGWQTVDVTSLVQGWYAGDFANYGILLEQGATAFTEYHSSEHFTTEMRPKLEVCYTVGSVTECETLQRGSEHMTMDSYINQLYPDFNNGAAIYFFTGLFADQFKQAMLWFDLEAQVIERASLGDYVWYDMNRDGIQDDGEPGVPDVVVHLYNCDDVLLATTTTDGNGNYLFDGLMPGDYYVVFEAPDGFFITLQDQGDDALDSDADMNGKTICTNLESGENDMTWDAGLYSILQEGCTLTIGYWKTHAGFGPQADVVTQHLPIWLGNAGGSHSMQVTSAQMAYDILTQKVYGHPSNGITKLYAQLLAAKFNMAADADGSDVADELGDADDFLADHDYTAWSGMSKKDQKGVNKLKSAFDKYNNGDLGPGHCGDDIIDDD